MTNDNDLIRRGDALTILSNGSQTWGEAVAAIAALPAVAASQPAVINEDGRQRVNVEEIFMSAVWGALKADAKDLHKQRRILDAFRCAIDVQPASRDEYEVCSYCSGSGMRINDAGDPDICRKCTGDTVVATVDPRDAQIAALVEAAENVILQYYSRVNGVSQKAISDLRAALAAVQPAQVQVKWDKIETAPRGGEWFIARTEHGTTRVVRFADEYDRFPISHDGVVWPTAPIEWTPLRPVLAALEPQHDPRDEVIARLVEALEMMRSTYPYNPPCFGWQEQVEAHKSAKVALAAAKAVQQKD